jgi:hypothetical protein
MNWKAAIVNRRCVCFCVISGQLRFRIVELAKEKDRFSTYVDHMPTEVLGRVISFLGEEDILDGFLPAYRVLGGELHHRVPWGTIGDENGEGRYVDMLSVLRGLMLAETASTANFVVHWKPEDEGMYRKWKNILASESLRRVVVFDPSVLLGQTVSNEVRTLKIFLTLDSCGRGLTRTCLCHVGWRKWRSTRTWTTGFRTKIRCPW